VGKDLQDRGAPWLGEEDKARMQGLKRWLKEGNEASSFPGVSGLDGLRYLLVREGCTVTGLCVT